MPRLYCLYWIYLILPVVFSCGLYNPSLRARAPYSPYMRFCRLPFCVDSHALPYPIQPFAGCTYLYSYFYLHIPRTLYTLLPFYGGLLLLDTYDC